MRILIILFALIPICYNTETTCADFNARLSTACQNIIPSSGTCIYLANQCVQAYTTCTDYAPTTGFDESICKALTTTTARKKCGVVITDDIKTCEEVDKTCEELYTKEDCLEGVTQENSRCLFVGGILPKCELHYDSCENTALDTKEKCEANIPKVPTDYCTWSGSSCTSANRKCEDYIIYEGKDTDDKNLDCTDIEVLDKECILYGDICYYKECIGFSEEECSNIKPFYEGVGFSRTEKCSYVWVDEERKCSPVARTCGEYKRGYDDETICPFLTITENMKLCRYDPTKEKCRELYHRCSDYNSIPVDERNNGTCHESITVLMLENPYIECYLNADKECTEFDKPCSKLSESYCNAKDFGSDSPKRCLFVNNACIETYKTCEDYEYNEELNDQKNNDTCHEIILEDPYKECYLNEDKECVPVDKPCSKLTENSCNAKDFGTSSPKRCLFVNNACIETYKNCELYQSEVSELAKRKKEDCEIIDPYYTYSEKGEDSSKIFKCVFDDAEDKKTCKGVLKQCEDYKGADEIECDRLTGNIGGDEAGKMKCKIIEGKCVKQYINCNTYDSTEDSTNKTICESIKLTLENKKCILKNDKTCKEIFRSCSEYKGNSQSKCSSYGNYDEDDYKICSIVNGKCTEIPNYYYCSDYRGTNQNECESIKPYRTDGYGIDTSSKCVYTSKEGCIKQAKPCREAASEFECPLIIPSDSEKKQCVYVNGACVEQYKTCALYDEEEDERPIDKTICESIVIKGTTENHLTHRCKYTPVDETDPDSRATCTSVRRECSDFNAEMIKGQCSNIIPTDITKKCVFDNNNCSPQSKTCLEMSLVNFNTGDDPDEICGNADTSSQNKECKAKSDDTGCEEVDKEITPTPSPSPSPGQNEDDTTEGPSPTPSPGPSPTPSPGQSPTPSPEQSPNPSSEQGQSGNNSSSFNYINKMLLISFFFIIF